MNVYYIELLNKTEQELYVNVGDKEAGSVKAGEKFRYATGNAVEKVELKSTLLGSNDKWKGTIPSNIETIIYLDEGNINVYIENNKIPACVFDGSCDGPVREREGCFSLRHILLFIIMVLVILILLSLFRRGGKKRTSLPK